jgi:hypothetical protein
MYLKALNNSLIFLDSGVEFLSVEVIWPNNMCSNL